MGRSKPAWWITYHLEQSPTSARARIFELNVVAGVARGRLVCLSNRVQTNLS